MKLIDLLLEKKDPIIKAWCELTRRTYPKESQQFFSKRDQFGNPVGHTIFIGLPLLFEALVEDKDPDNVANILDGIIRVRAIQEFSPSEAVSFVLGLKSIIREELGVKILQNGLSEEWAILDGKIDSIALLGFDLYSRCRQSIADIRVKEVQKRSERLLQMAGLTYEIPEYKGDRQEDEAGNG